MKRLIFLIICLTGLGLLAACTGDVAPTTPATEVATVGPVPTEAPTEMPTVPPTEVMATETPPPEPTAVPAEEPTQAATAVPTEAATAGADMGAVGLELVADGLTAPIALAPVPDDSGRLFVVDQTGQIYIVGADGQMMAQPFLDIQSRMVTLNEGYDERGLLGLAFHPDYAENGRFFVYYSAPLEADAPQAWNHTSRLSEFTVSADNPNTADPDSERILLEIDEPQANHNAGSITFGPDGYLYVPLGDGGGANDVDIGHVEDWYETNEGGNGQDIDQNLLGSILRLDINVEPGNAEGQTYAYPGDNPFIDQPESAAIWAFGFRNPYRISFDMGGDNALFVGDAGQDRWEEVSIVEAGGNYGWNVMEGTHCFSTANPDQSLDSCPSEDADGRPLIDPIIEYQNANAEGGLGLVVIGGNVYRGSAMPGWDGVYIFGDWSTSFGAPDGTLFAATPPATEGEMWSMQPLTISTSEDGSLNEFLLSFGQDNEGEIYVLTSGTAGPSGSTGKVYKIVPPQME